MSHTMLRAYGDFYQAVGPWFYALSCAAVVLGACWGALKQGNA